LTLGRDFQGDADANRVFQELVRKGRDGRLSDRWVNVMPAFTRRDVGVVRMNELFADEFANDSLKSVAVSIARLDRKVLLSETDGVLYLTRAAGRTTRPA
jgi:hypothetical protein